MAAERRPRPTWSVVLRSRDRRRLVELETEAYTAALAAQVVQSRVELGELGAGAQWDVVAVYVDDVQSELADLLKVD